jgi:membrane-bound serine protease (ClpP class)
VVAGTFVVTMTAGARALRRPPMLGAASMIGMTGVARGRLDPVGPVHIRGEIWRAVTPGPVVEEGQAVRVVGVEGLTLKVVKAEGEGGAV